MTWHNGQPRLRLTADCTAEEIDEVFASSMVDVAYVVGAIPDAVLIVADDPGWPKDSADYEWLCSVIKETLEEHGISGITLTYEP